jgi:CRISPR-associated exonuclease Cas4
LKVAGIIDAVEECDGQLVPVEYKKGKMAQHLNDHFQLCAAALCLEERTGRSITCGDIFYHANRRRQTVAFTPQLRQMTEQAIALAQLAATKAMPSPIDHAKKCLSCSLQGICLPFEVKQLQKSQAAKTDD